MKLDKDVKPFLRWAGGKTWLIRDLSKIVNDNFVYNNYHEPFIGGGAMFLSLIHPKKVYLSDMNTDLINTYICIKNNPDKVISFLKTYENTEQFYYELRSKITDNEYEKAAQFIYLNQTSYNGLYRVNKKGEYNVPYGHRSKNFLEEEKLKKISCLLKSTNIKCGDFEIFKNEIEKNDLVFLDPPYTVSHNNNGFIKYNQQLFSLEDQVRLSKYIDYIKSVGGYYILTNAAHNEIDKIFDKGDRKLILRRPSLIGGKQSLRKYIEEYVFTNIEGEM